MIDSSQSSSTRPDLLRALFEWCADNGLTPYVAAFVDDSVKVPREHVKNQEIVLNISMDATSNLKIGNDYLEFKARFGGVAREIVVPIDHIIAIYARENGQGMAFPVPQAVQAQGDVAETKPSERRQPNLRSVAPAPEAAGPREATVEPASSNGSDKTKVVKLTPASAPAPGDQPPDPHKGKGTGRPSLTRIK